MGRRLLRITDDLLVHILKGFEEGPPVYFRVVKDAVPSDAKIVGIQVSPYYPGRVEILLESETWDTDEPRLAICPHVEVVKAEPTVGNP